MKIMWLAMILAVCGFVTGARAEHHQIGGGVHYWRTIDEIDDDDGDIDEDGFGFVASYQYRPGLLGLGIDVEWKDKGFAGAPEDVYEPQAYLIVGGMLYAAGGIGGYYTDGEFADDPFYLFRAGLDLEILPAFHLDIHAIYRFEEWEQIDEEPTEVDTDTVTIGVAARIEL